MNESVLIGRAEKFLDEIRRGTINADNIHDLKEYMNIYDYLKNNLDELQEFKDIMEIKGYKAPYRNLMNFSRAANGEMQVEDLHDITRHTQHFRMRAALKKNILDRVKSSIASHKIAIGHLEEYAIIKCNDCGNDYSGHEIADIVNNKCICGSINLQLNVNNQGVHRLEIIKYLPLSGEYMVKMSELTIHGREAFRRIVRILKQEKRGIVKTVSLVVKVFENGRWVRRRVSLDVDEEINYEQEMRKKYGSNARIEYLQFHRKKPSIINDKHVQNALALGYVKLVENHAIEILPIILEKQLENPDKLRKYDLILKKVRIASNRMTDFEDQNVIERELLNEELAKEGLMTNNILDKELTKDIKVRSNIEKNIYSNAPRVLILWDLMKYYLGTSYDRRSKYSGPFPNLRPVLDKNQLTTFTDFQKSIVECLKEYLMENIEYIPNLEELLNKKFEIERKLKGLHLKLKPPAVGAVILHTTGNLSLEDSARIFSVKIEEVNEDKEKIETFQKPTNTKAQKFLEMIKN